MKTVLFFAAALTFLQQSSAAPIAVTGSMHYTQNFDVLDTATNASTSTTPWADDGTIPGWYLYRAGATSAGLVGAAYTYRVSDGDPGLGNTLANTGHFYSIGALNESERALGAVPITAQGEFSCIAMFHNEGPVPVVLSNIAFQAEVRRTNQNANNVETIAVWWRKEETEAALLTNTTAEATAAEFPAAVSTAPGGQYVIGWNRAGTADFTYSSPQANTKLYFAQTVSAAPPEEIRVLPGEYLAVRWGNINDGGADAVMGIDDVDLTFTAASDAIAGVATNVVRHDNGTPRIPADDTVNFDLTVNGTGGVSPSGWKITAPATLAGTTGAYGTPVNLTNVAIGEFTGTSHVLTLTVEDADSASISTPVRIVAPWCRIVPAAAGFLYDDMGTPDAADDTVTYSLSADGTFTGTDFLLPAPDNGAPYGMAATITRAAPGTFTTHTFTDSADAACTASLSVFPPAILGTNATTLTPGALYSLPVAQNGNIQWVVNGTARTITQTSGTAQADQVLLSEVVNLTAGPTVQFSATLVASGGASGFETTDSFALDLIIDGGAPVSVLGTANDTDGDGRLTGIAELPAAATADRTYNFIHTLPAAAASVQVRLTGNSNSPNELLTVSNLRLEIPQPAVTVSAASTVIRNANGPGAGDDTVSFDVTISGVNGGTGWTASGATPASGSFGPATLTVPAGGSTATVRITDNTFPAAFQDVTVPLPGPYVIGSVEPGTGSAPVFTAETPAPDAEWVISGTPPSLRMNGNGLAAPLKTVTSEEVSLAAATGALEVKANLHVRDTSSGFEPTDEFNAWIILDGDTASPLPMITRWDSDASGLMNGTELCPAPAVANTPQDFDYALTAVIPAGTGKVQIVFTGLCNSPNETMTISGILIVPGTVADDSDGDGQSNQAELLAGTNPDDPRSSLRTSLVTVDAATGAATLAWSSVPGKTYQVQSSPDLVEWTDTGSDVTADGPEASTTVMLPGAPLTGKGFLRVRVVAAP